MKLIFRELWWHIQAPQPQFKYKFDFKICHFLLTLCWLVVIYSTELLCFLSLALFFFFFKVRGREFGWASLVAQLVKNPPAMRETWVWSLGWKDPLEEERSPGVILTPVFLSGESPWTEELGRWQSMESQRVRHNWMTSHSTGSLGTQEDFFFFF